MPRINPVLDARHLTDFSPACVQEEKYMRQLNLKDSRELKMALMNNGTQLLQNDAQRIEQTIASLAYTSNTK